MKVVAEANAAGERPALDVARHMYIGDFKIVPPKYEITQDAALAWLAAAHARSGVPAKEAILSRLRRYGCAPDKIHKRAVAVDDFTHDHWDRMKIFNLVASPGGAGMSERMAVFSAIVADAFDALYPEGAAPPPVMIHVTCTGYAAPGGAHAVIDRRGWHQRTRVINAYHMGCYAAVPATAIASALAGGYGRIDIIHTELCSLHLDLSNRSPEQLVVQSLFGDGIIKYSVYRDCGPSVSSGAESSRKLRLLATREETIPGSLNAMSWSLSGRAMQMTLSRDVPELIRRHLIDYLHRLCADAGLDFGECADRAAFAVHPGGPGIVDAVRRALNISDERLAATRDVLRDHGNMSSSTLPHIWKRVAEDLRNEPGTPVISVAFGPGLVIAGTVMEAV